MSPSMSQDVKHENSLSDAMKALSSLAVNSVRCPHRLAYHFMAPAAWINDPNGMIFFQDEYHMFYQIHPFSGTNGLKHWGHAKSKDLVHWEHLPMALAPSEEFEKNGCFSGTAVDNDGVFTLIYTGNSVTVDEVTGNTTKKQVQCVAMSYDGGITFHKYSGNPVISDFPVDGSADFRDPKVWKANDTWYMSVGSGKDGIANALIYKSANLLDWEYAGKMAESVGDQGVIWNCPDFFSIGETDVFLVSPAVWPGQTHGRKAIYFTGKMDYASGKFLPQLDEDIDYGCDFYAPQTLGDDRGRVILIGWMDMWWNTMPSKQFDWTGAMTIPRLVTLLPDGKLAFQPVSELQMLRDNHFQLINRKVMPESFNLFGDLQGDALEIVARFDLTSCEAASFGLKLRRSAGGEQETLVKYDVASGVLTVDRTKSGAGDTHNCLRKLHAAGGMLELHIFVDRSSVELFADEGRTVITNRIYPDPTSQGIDLFAEGGGVMVTSIDIWKLKSIW